MTSHCNTQHILKSFTDFLCDNLDGFDELEWKLQFNVARLAFMVGQKWRGHNTYDGYASIGYQLLRSMFNRQLKSINATFDLFDITDDWSKREKRTRGVKLSDKLQTMMTAFFECDPAMSELISESGSCMRSPPKNVFDDTVNATFRKNTDEKVTVAINYAELANLIAYLAEMPEIPDIDTDAMLTQARLVRSYTHLIAAGKHNLILRYGETSTGRLRGKGAYHLQGVRNPITDACLHGLPKYDIDNCHWVIFRSLALRIGIHCPAVGNYIANKKAIREQIARDVGIAVKIVKTCLIALMYGAKLSEWYKAAIPKAIIGKGTRREIPYEEGMRKAGALYNHPVYRAIAEEVNLVRPEIIAQWPKSQRKKLTNEMGKKISGSEDERTIMARLQQGIEARMLYAAIDLYPWVLLKYDGFTTSSPIDTSMMISRIENELGMDVTIEEDIHQNDVRFLEAFLTPQPRTNREEPQAGIIHTVL